MLRPLLSALVLVALTRAAAADTFSGFAGTSYVVSPDRVCTPLTVAKGRARGTPSCQAVGAATLAKIGVKAAAAETGTSARFAARIDGKCIVVSRADGSEALRWQSIDPLVRLGAVYADAGATQVVVEVATRSMGHEAVTMVGFAVDAPAVVTPPVVVTPPAPVLVDPPEPDAAMEKALKTARARPSLASWQAVLTLDPDASEAQAGVAAVQARAGKAEEALVALEKLATSLRTDAIEYLVAARFDKAFAKLAADPRYRTAVGLDRGATQLYDRIMGQGGTWEQTGTSCANPTVALNLVKQRTFTLVVKTVCDGDKWTSTFKGTWRLDGDATLMLVLPNKGAADEVVPCGVTHVGDEDQVACKIDEDLEFIALPVRR